MGSRMLCMLKFDRAGGHHCDIKKTKIVIAYYLAQWATREAPPR
jgi:hypothetical protein